MTEDENDTYSYIGENACAMGYKNGSIAFINDFTDEACNFQKHEILEFLAAYPLWLKENKPEQFFEYMTEMRIRGLLEDTDSITALERRMAKLETEMLEKDADMVELKRKVSGLDSHHAVHLPGPNYERVMKE